MLFVLVALKAKVVADDVAAYFFIVGLVSALIGVILVLDWSHSRIAQIASMTIFWLLFMLLFVVFCNKEWDVGGLQLSSPVAAVRGRDVLLPYRWPSAGPFSQFDGVANGLVAPRSWLSARCSLSFVWFFLPRGERRRCRALRTSRGLLRRIISQRGGRGAGLSDQGAIR